MKVTLAARPPLSASLQSLGFGSLELKSWLLELPNSIISLSFDHPTRILGVTKNEKTKEKKQTIFFASSGSACAGDEGDAVEGRGLGASWVEVGDEDMMGECRLSYVILLYVEFVVLDYERISAMCSLSWKVLRPNVA